ncbi:MAG TPA: hypothetical protein VLJ42_06405 [Solirubrobacteraceae bacterium]|nr:hypothetical protein [Solirubrobacteraceae bacterium]
MRRISPVVLVVPVLLIALAGCGSSGHSTSSSAATSTEPSISTFTSEFRTQKAALGALGKDVGAAVQGARHQTDSALTQQFQGLASRATALAGTLGQLNAPTQYKSDLSALQSSITQVAGTLNSIEAAAAAHDANAAKAGGEAIVANAQQVKNIDNTLSAKLGLPTSP